MNFNKQNLLNYLHNKKLNIIFLSEVDSTNTYLKHLANQGCSENTLVIADHQTKGKGRYNRKFFSPAGCGLYMSLLLRPKLSSEKTMLLTAAIAVAVKDSIELLSGKKPQIKWVNDILINGKKVCGILTEGSINSITGNFDWAVLGIGVNVYTPQNNFNKEIRDIATSVFQKKDSDMRSRLCAEIINRFYYFYDHIDDKTFIKDYRNSSCLLGQHISVIKGNNIIPALALDIDDRCRLLVEYNNGSQEYLSSNEVSIKL